MSWARPRSAAPAVVLLVAVASVVPGIGCRTSTEPREYEARLQVAADSVDCFGMHPRKCLYVRELVGGDAWTSWGAFYAPIDGFAHEPGFVYDLIVGRREIRNPPADGSSVSYRLISIVSMVPN